MIKKFFLLLVVVFVITTGFTTKKEVTNKKTVVSEQPIVLVNSVVKESSMSLFAVLNEGESREEKVETFSMVLGKSFFGFKEALAFKESQGRYFIVNEFGYLGKYQFGKSTLKTIGVYNVNQFLNNPSLQEMAFEANLSRNKWVLRRDIKRFVGKTINGVKVTESGILAAAHLGGPGSVKKFLRSYGSNVFTDAYGSSIKFYMKKFGGYDVSSVEQDRRAKVLL